MYNSVPKGGLPIAEQVDIIPQAAKAGSLDISTVRATWTSMFQVDT